MNISQLIENCQKRSLALQEMIPVKAHELRIAEIDELMNASDIWSDNRRAAGLLKERQVLTSLLGRLKDINDQVSLYTEYMELFPGEIEGFAKEILKLDQDINDFEIKQLLSGEHDNGAAILTITAGSGGTESKNFCQMLCRMYMRYADLMGWKVEILDEKPSEEHSDICLDSISLQMSGEYAYGYLKNETGVHRLIRNSPFNSAEQRHTSFVAVSILPDIEDKINIIIIDNDLEWEVMRSSGSGGQSVNTTESAVRVRHKTSGIAVRAQTEKSQHENRRIALKILKAKLYELELKRLQTKKDKIISNLSTINFGHQKRTITLSPYSLVKDHYSGFESNQADKFLDGYIHNFIISNLHYRFK